MASHPIARRILCHGTRRGVEQQLFMAAYHPHVQDVLGTEISPSATEFPLTVQWDFSVPNPEWIGAWDVVYSNSFDHAFDPAVTLHTWADQLAPAGSLFIDISIRTMPDRYDPLVITPAEIEGLARECGLAMVQSTRILMAPGRRQRHHTISCQFKRV